MIMTGKRHPFIFEYEVGFSDNGRINGLKILMAAPPFRSVVAEAALADVFATFSVSVDDNFISLISKPNSLAATKMVFVEIS